MKRHLELPTDKLAQQSKLLRQLDGWDRTQLDEKLESLQSKGIVKITSDNKAERRISLVGLTEEEQKVRLINIDSKEKVLLLLLQNSISQNR